MSKAMDEEPLAQPSELLARAVSGDATALECLLVPYQSRLLGRLTRKLPDSLRSVVAPEDLLQETFVEVFRQIRDFVPHGTHAFVRWLVMVTDGRLIHAIRRHSAAKRGGGRAPLNVIVEGSSALPLLEMLEVDTRTPSRAASARELATALRSALLSLKEEYREAVRYRFLEGLSVAEISARLGKSEWSVHKLCSRGLGQLRQELARGGGP